MRMFFKNMGVTALTFLLSLSPQADASEITVPGRFESCIRDRMQTVVSTQSRVAAWNQFRGYAANELLGMTAVGVRTWQGFNTYERTETLKVFFERLFQHRRIKHPRMIDTIQISGRPLPDHARGDLIHVNIIITYSNGDETRLNLLGTSRCKVVDVAWGNAWLSRQISVGTIERRAYTAYKRAQQKSN